MSSVADYAGRTIDLSLFANVPTVEGVEQLLTQDFASGTGRGELVTGVQKVAQRFLLRLYNIRGATPYDTEGCYFLSDQVSGGWHSVEDVYLSFAAAKPLIAEQFAAERTDFDEPDEVYVDASLENVLLARGIAVLHIRLTTAAGVSRKIISPLPGVV